MCGIAGYMSLDGSERPNASIIKVMCDALFHRGPDDYGVMVDGPVGLGMRRLSIIDLGTGHQPIHNEDQTVWVVLNGEIYNYRELRKDLIDKGHAFYTSTDTEVLVHLFEEYGEECVDHLRGMFAFAIWNKPTNTLLLARDRMGEKPLYYFTDSRTLVFASELKAILKYSGMARDVNVSALLGYLQYNYVPEPLSIFSNIHKLSAGHLIVVKNGIPVVKKYWDIPLEEDSGRTEEDYRKELLERLQEAVRLQLVSDVPLGAFLSGGIDSSTVVALMANVMNRPVETFSIGFEEEKFNELPYARQMAMHLGTHHHELILEPTSINFLETVTRHFDEPFGDPSAIPTFFVSKLAHDHVKVVLTGDGGDELFGGYDRYLEAIKRRKYDLLSMGFQGAALQGLSSLLPDGTPGKNFLYNISLSPDKRYIDSVSYVPRRRWKTLLSPELLDQMLVSANVEFLEPHFTKVQGLDPLSRLLYVDMKTYLPGDILAKVDRMSMALSLESRCPFLDHPLVEFVARMPGRYKLGKSYTKHILKTAMAGLLPREIVNRKKKGFGIPLRSWFKEDLLGVVKDILMDPKTRERGYFNNRYVETLISETDRQKKDHSRLLWSLLVLEIWCRNYVDQSSVFSKSQTAIGIK